MASKIKVDTLETANGSGTIALSNQLSGMTTASLPALTGAQMPAGSSVQMVSVKTGALATGTTTMPNDNTIVQNTEGNEYMTLAITPTSASNKLVIESIWNGFASNNEAFMISLFQDSTANALGTVWSQNVQERGQYILRHVMTAGTTSATTFKIRAGSSAGGTTSFNGISGAARFAGTMASTIVITEYKA